tara:strand:- start:280 stop:453 length:174 start_codon:yes stop_codon:yes gene_type:complete
MNKHDKNKKIINEKLNELGDKSFELLQKLDSSDNDSYTIAYKMNQIIHDLKRHLIID